MTEVKVAFVAPGQGIESWQDGLRLLNDWPQTEELYERVKLSTGVDIISICQSQEPIHETSIVQPAALGVGYARSEYLKQVRGISPNYLIGLSAGEFTVAAISGAISLEDAAMAAMRRGILQNEAAGGKGGAVTAMHRRPLKVSHILNGLDGAWLANKHAPTLTGFSYLHENYETLKERLASQGAKVRDIKNLHFPPHGAAVLEAQHKIAEMLRARGIIKDANTSIISIRTARAMKKARAIRRNLVWQTSQPTRLNDAVNYAIRNGVSEFYDLGPGDSITKLLGYIITKKQRQNHFGFCLVYLFTI